MPRISTYGNDPNLTGSDRVIGTDGATGQTMNFTLMALQAFITSGIQTSHNEFILIASDNTDVLDNGNARLFLGTDGRITIERRQDDAWVEIAEFGGSIETDKVILNNFISSIGLLLNGETFNFARTTTSIDGAAFGDMERNTFISTGDQIQIIEMNQQRDDNVQTETTDSVTTQRLDFVAVGTVFAKIKTITVNTNGAPNGLRWEVKRDSMAGDIVHENISQYDFEENRVAIPAGDHVFDLNTNPLYTAPGVLLYISIYSHEDVTYNGLNTPETTVLGATVPAQFTPKVINNIIEGDRYVMTHEGNIVSQLVAKTGDDRLSITNLKDVNETVEDIIGNKVVAGTGISVNYNDTTGETTIAATGSTFDTPRITNLSIDIASRVDQNTNLNVAKTITFDLMHSENIDGNLALVVTTGDNQVISTPFVNGENSKSVTLSGINTSAEGTLTFQLSGTDTMGGVITSNTVSISIRTLEDDDYFYYGLSSSNDPDTIDISGMSRIEATAGNHNISTGATTAGQYFILLTPDANSVERITDNVLQQDVLSIFTKTEDVRQINSANFDSYVLGPLNSGGDEMYTVRLV